MSKCIKHYPCFTGVLLTFAATFFTVPFFFILQNPGFEPILRLWIELKDFQKSVNGCHAFNNFHRHSFDWKLSTLKTKGTHLLRKLVTWEKNPHSFSSQLLKRILKGDHLLKLLRQILFNVSPPTFYWGIQFCAKSEQPNVASQVESSANIHHKP